MGRWPLVLGASLAAAALLLPADALLDFLAARFNTVRGFRLEFARSLFALRLALAFNGVSALAISALLARRPLVPDGKPMPRPEGAPSIALYGISFLLALPGVFESFQDDEWRCLEQYVRHGPLVIATRSNADNHVLYSLLAWPFVAVLGTTEAAVRLPALLLTPLAAPLLYAFLRRSREKATAFIGAIPLAVSPFLLEYAHEGRAYGPVVVAVAGMLLVREGAGEGRRRAWLAFVALGVAAVYLHIFAAAAVAGLVLPSLVRDETRPRAAAALLAVGAFSALLLSPVLPSYFAYAAGERPPAGGSLASGLAGLFVPALPAAAAVPFLAAGMLGARRERPLTVAFCGTLALLTAMVALSAAGYGSRFFASLLPMAWALAALGISSSGRPGLLLALVLLGLGLAVDAAYYRTGRRDYRAVAREIESRRAPGESLAVQFDGRPMTPYLRDPLPVLTERELRRASPDWLMIVDVNAVALRAWLSEEYEIVFRKPSTRGELEIHRRRRR